MDRVDDEEIVSDTERNQSDQPLEADKEKEDRVVRRAEPRRDVTIRDWKEWISAKVDERRIRRVERPGTLTLTGLVELVVSGNKAGTDRIFIEWKADQICCWTTDTKPDTFGSPDCIITVTEDIFEELRSGNINAQIAMCAGKIKVSGNSDSYAELAMYTFNIFGQY